MPQQQGVAYLLWTDRPTQLAMAATMLLLFTSSKFVNELGKSEMDLKKSQHAEALHRQLWRYSRDKMSSTTALRLRFVGTAFLATMWAGVFATQLFGLSSNGSMIVSACVALGLGFVFAAFELKSHEDKVEETEAIPVTIVTGWLGAGKTTMIQHILRESHGKRILVVENEAGSIGVDHDLLVGKGDIGDEEVVLLRNGCVCCSVRADLSRVLKEQLKRNQRAKKRDAKQAGAGSGVGGLTKSFARSVLAFLDRKLIGDDDDDDKAKDKDKDGKKKKNGDAKDGDKGSTENDDGRAFDAIIVETTGVALVSPIIQLFFADFEVRKQTRLDAVITVVDARHIWNHLALEQQEKSHHHHHHWGGGKVVVNNKQGGREEVAQQIAYADRVVVNKADLVVSSSSSSGSSSGSSSSGGSSVGVCSSSASSLLSPSKRTVVEIKEESGEEGDSDDDDDDAVVVGSGGGVAADAAAAADEAAVDASNKPPPSLPLESPPPPPPSLEQVCMAVRSLNPRCEILKATKGAVPIDQLLGIRAFDLKCQVIQPSLLKKTDDAAVAAVPKKAETTTEAAAAAAAAAVSTATPTSTTTSATAPGGGGGGGGGFGAGNVFHTMQFQQAHKSMVETFTLVHESDGRGGNEVDLDKFNAWLPQLLTESGEQLYRLKGFLAVKGEDRKFLCQGVHMTFTGERGEAWGSGKNKNKEARKSTLVFIGKAPLPKTTIAAAFENCLTPKTK